MISQVTTETTATRFQPEPSAPDPEASWRSVVVVGEAMTASLGAGSAGSATSAEAGSHPLAHPDSSAVCCDFRRSGTQTNRCAADPRLPYVGGSGQRERLGQRVVGGVGVP